jgi:lipid A oxidase
MIHPLLARVLAAACLTFFAAMPASADMAVSVYGGFQTTPHSDVDVSDGPDIRAGWDGKSFQTPPITACAASGG